METDFEAWNKLVSESKNGTFLFDRNFMDYHKHKFQDFSLMIYNEKKQNYCYYACSQNQVMRCLSFRINLWRNYYKKTDQIDCLFEVFRDF